LRRGCWHNTAVKLRQVHLQINLKTHRLLNTYYVHVLCISFLKNKQQFRNTLEEKIYEAF
jgi:hypothetical protein